MDELAAELGVDPMEIREKNWITHEEFPFTHRRRARLRHRQLRGGNRQGQAGIRLRRAARRAEAATRLRRPGAARYRHLDLHGDVRTCAIALARRRSGYIAGGWEHASIRMLPTGKVEVVTGTSPHGQGHETAWSQIVADRLGVAFEDVEVLHGDTQMWLREVSTRTARAPCPWAQWRSSPRPTR